MSQINDPIDSSSTSLFLKLNIGPSVGSGCSGVVSPILQVLDGGRYVVKEVKLDKASVAVGSLPDDSLAEEVRLHRLCSAECSSVVRYVFACQAADSLMVLMERCDAILWDALTGNDVWCNLTNPLGCCDVACQPHSAERLAWTKGLCEAVRHCHRLRVLHRDINPWNVFLVAPSVGSVNSTVTVQQDVVRFLPRLADFGLSVELKSDSQELNGCCSEGAPPLDDSALSSLYSAPELGKQYSLPADIFSLGMTLFALWSSVGTGGEETLIEKVVVAKDAAISGAGLELSHLTPTCEELRLSALISRMLSSQTWSRPDAREVCSSLEKTLEKKLESKHAAKIREYDQLSSSLDKLPENAPVAKIREKVEQVFQDKLARNPMVPRRQLESLMSILGLESAPLLGAAAIALGWSADAEEVDYRALLRWIYQDGAKELP